MYTTRNTSELQDYISAWKNQNLRIGFVPTMGALHAGHMTLIKKAMAHGDRVVVSIFVNPTQFAPHEDLKTYPGTYAHDAQQLKSAGVHLLYHPAVDTIYPHGHEDAQTVKPGPAADGLESESRPHFFAGVVNVLTRLFDHVQPDFAVFGEKDFQQLQVVREMIRAQNLPIDILAAPTVRDKHGLALSSRNAYLSKAETIIARTLNTTLLDTAHALNTEPDSTTLILKNAEKALLDAGFDRVDYINMRWNRVLTAVHIGKARLIDNVALETQND